MNRKSFFTTTMILAFVIAIVYLFVTAPAKIEVSKSLAKNTFSVEDGFKIVAAYNDLTRTFYTKNIVGAGKNVGLMFDEDWKDDNVEAGPLPALFLRETSNYIEKSKVELGLYLGSEFPISEANLFTGVQAEYFEKIKANKQPQFFFDDDTQRYVGMFPDFASAKACITCHNEHPDSPRNDWKLGDIMGATTWSFKSDSLTTDELIEWIKVYGEGTKHTYQLYLEEVNNFTTADIPAIGNLYPSEGYQLPSVTSLEDTISKLSSTILLSNLLRKEDEK